MMDLRSKVQAIRARNSRILESQLKKSRAETTSHLEHTAKKANPRLGRVALKYSLHAR